MLNSGFTHSTTKELCVDQSPATDDPTEPAATGGGPDNTTTWAAIARATGVVMAWTPCTSDSARRILANTARAAGTTTQHLAENVIATHARTLANPRLEALLRAEVSRAQTPPAKAFIGLRPPPGVLREHINELRSARRRTLAAPHDPGQRSELDAAAYTLCVLMGQRNAYAALVAAEEEVATHRLPPAPADPPPLPTG
ncbi:DUF5133 domain-containing protein [Streptomyces sp. NPDC005533]|uniref:DUF5133 domain-containing protein n=1 Tax=Streptomyces sp. NPDC005533 TaxID=3364723 RepID=UPI0036AB98A5